MEREAFRSFREKVSRLRYLSLPRLSAAFVGDNDWTPRVWELRDIVGVHERLILGARYPVDAGLGELRDQLLTDVTQQHVLPVVHHRDETVSALLVVRLTNLDERLAAGDRRIFGSSRTELGRW